VSNAKGILDSLSFQPGCSYRHVFGNHHDSSIRDLPPCLLPSIQILALLLDRFQGGKSG